MSSRNRNMMQGVVFAGYDYVVQAVFVRAHGCYFGFVIISRTGGVTSVLWLFDNTWVLSAHWHWICLRDILPCFCVCPRAHCQTSPTDTNQRMTDLANQRMSRDCTLHHLLVDICSYSRAISFLLPRFSVNHGDVVLLFKVQQINSTLWNTPHAHLATKSLELPIFPNSNAHFELCTPEWIELLPSDWLAVCVYSHMNVWPPPQKSGQSVYLSSLQFRWWAKGAGVLILLLPSKNKQIRADTLWSSRQVTELISSYTHIRYSIFTLDCDIFCMFSEHPIWFNKWWLEDDNIIIFLREEIRFWNVNGVKCWAKRTTTPLGLE